MISALKTDKRIAYICKKKYMRLLRIAIVSVATVYMLYSCDMPDYKRAAARIDSLLSERYLDDEPGAAILEIGRASCRGRV